MVCPHTFFMSPDLDLFAKSLDTSALEDVIENPERKPARVRLDSKRTAGSAGVGHREI